MDPSSQPTYGMTGDWQPAAAPQHPEERKARRRAVAAAMIQLASPFLFVGMLFLGLTADIPVGGDPHGYVQIFGFFASFLLFLPGIALPAIAIGLLRNSRRSGAVWLIVAAVLWCLFFVILATGFPGGITELEWSRILTIAVGVLWAAVSGWCTWAGVAAFSRLPGG